MPKNNMLMLLILMIFFTHYSIAKTKYSSIIVKDINDNNILDTILIRGDSLILVMDRRTITKYAIPCFYENIRLINSSIKNSFLIENLYNEKQQTSVLYRFQYKKQKLFLKLISVRFQHQDVYGKFLREKIKIKQINKEYKNEDYSDIINDLF